MSICPVCPAVPSMIMYSDKTTRMLERITLTAHVFHVYLSDYTVIVKASLWFLFYRDIKYFGPRAECLVFIMSGFERHLQ